MIKNEERRGRNAMTSYVPIIVSVISLLLALYTSITKNSKENTSELTTVIVKLENIGNGIADIKAEIASMKNDQKEDHDRLIKLDTSLSAAWKQISELKEK